MNFVLVGILCGLSVVRSEELEVRGVDPKLIDRYKPDADGFFHCLNDSSIKIPFNRVNDDYCDCADGSDEPGTSACANGRFYCRNIGFKGNYIPSAWVDDGICDYDLCCDGSEEKSGKCENRCQEYNRKYEQERKRNNMMVDKGLKVKRKIIEASQKKRKLLKEQVSMLIEEQTKVQNKLHTLQEQSKKMNTENRKAVDKAFMGYEEKLKSISEKADIQDKKVNELKTRLFNLEQALETMVKEYNHNFNDPAVKRAAKIFQDYAANQEILKEEETRNSDTLNGEFQSLKKLFAESKVSAADLQRQPTQSLSVRRAGWNKWFKATIENMVDSFLGVQSKKSVQDTTEIDMETVEKEIEEAEKRAEELKSTLEQKQKEVEKVYGPEDILRSKDDCIEKKLGDYVYRMCFTGEFVQKNRNSRGVRVGSYESAEYDDEQQQLVIKYVGGEKCWNGPKRSAEVRASCGDKDEILLVSEPEKCSYIFEMRSPMACTESQKY